jgi:hypothetical protein
MTQYLVARSNFLVRIQGSEDFILMPSTDVIKQTLAEMYKETWSYWNNNDPWEDFELAQKYGAVEKVRLSASSPLAQKAVTAFRQLNHAEDSEIENKLNEIDFYGAVFWNPENVKFMGVRRATQFKSILKAKNRLARWSSDDGLHEIEEHVIRIDKSFDFIIEQDYIYILSPIGFKLFSFEKSERLHAAASRVQELNNILTGFDLSNFIELIDTHTRSAQLLIGILSRDDISSIDISKIIFNAQSQGIRTELINNLIVVVDEHRHDFLEFLDCRRYLLDFTNQPPSVFQAANRRRLR